MKDETQLTRYKKLADYLRENFKEDLSIEKIEEVCHYSYRNINRIFHALHHETIGRHIKRIRMEKSAEYLKYSDRKISDIAYQVGFSEVASFSKAFKKHFDCSPSQYRQSKGLMARIGRDIRPLNLSSREKLPFQIEVLPELNTLYLEYRGPYENIDDITGTWNQLLAYAEKEELLSEDSIFMGEVLDDNEICEHINCRYNTSILLPDALKHSPEGLFKTKTLKRQKYAKFLHTGPHEKCPETYDKIYLQYVLDTEIELVDGPTLEFFLNDEEDTLPENLLTEIYIPIR